MGMKTVGVVMTKLIELFMDCAVHRPRGEALRYKGIKQRSMHDVVPVGDPTKSQSVIMIQKMQTTGGPKREQMLPPERQFRRSNEKANVESAAQETAELASELKRSVRQETQQ